VKEITSFFKTSQHTEISFLSRKSKSIETKTFGPSESNLNRYQHARKAKGDKNTSWDDCSRRNVSIIPCRDKAAIIQNAHPVGPDQNATSISIPKSFVNFRSRLTSRKWRKLQIAYKHVHRGHGFLAALVWHQCTPIPAKYNKDNEWVGSRWSSRRRERERVEGIQGSYEQAPKRNSSRGCDYDAAFTGLIATVEARKERKVE
jgi:hypothetical protein